MALEGSESSAYKRGERTMSGNRGQAWCPAVGGTEQNTGTAGWGWLGCRGGEGNMGEQEFSKAVNGLKAALSSSGLIENKRYDLVVSINEKQKQPLGKNLCPWWFNRLNKRLRRKKRNTLSALKKNL